MVLDIVRSICPFSLTCNDVDIIVTIQFTSVSDKFRQKQNPHPQKNGKKKESTLLFL